jgi:hypothetical protein
MAAQKLGGVQDPGMADRGSLELDISVLEQLPVQGLKPPRPAGPDEPPE